MPGLSEDGFDDQDGAETFDETNQDDREQIAEMRTFEEMPDVYDVTSRDGDRDDEDALALDADEFDEELIDPDVELEEDDELQLRYHAATVEEDDFYADADNPRADHYDEDALNSAESIEGLDEVVADANLVTGGEDDFTNFQSKGLSDDDLARMGYADAAPQDRDEALLDEALEQTFPASDPVSSNLRER